jgi:hypothetical protein
MKTRLALAIALYSIQLAYGRLLGEPSFPMTYFYAGVAGVFTVATLSFFGRSLIIRDVQLIQTVWVGIHALGFVMYQAGMPPNTYMSLQTFLEIYQFLWIFWARHDIRNHRTDDHGRDGIRKPDNIMHYFNNSRSHS